MFCKIAVLFCLLYCQNLAESVPKNDRPIVGILAQEYDLAEGISYIAMPYVQQMESSGARVVPILIEQHEDYYKRIIQETNGLLIPGGNRNLTDSAFQRAAEHLFHFATEANDRGELYPIYGICQGFEMTTILILQQWAKNPAPYRLIDCDSEDVALNLKFIVDPAQTRYFKDADPKLIDLLKNGSITPNFHHQCITPSDVISSGLDKHLRVLTTSNDSNGVEFVSTFESKNASRPIFLVQYHPEKVIEFKMVDEEQINVPHSSGAIKMSQFFGNFFVDQCRKNWHNFSSIEEENEALIYNCNPVYTMSNGADAIFEKEHFSQLYWFPSKEGCGGAGWTGFFNHNVLIVAGLCLTIIILLGVIVGRGMCSSRRGQYREIGGNYI